MEQVFRAKDGRLIPSKKLCKIYEDSIQRYDELPLDYLLEERDGWLKVNDLADVVKIVLYEGDTIYDGIFFDFLDLLCVKMKCEFPMWVNKNIIPNKIEIKKLEKEIEDLKQSIKEKTDNINFLKSLNK